MFLSFICQTGTSAVTSSTATPTVPSTHWSPDSLKLVFGDFIELVQLFALCCNSE